MRNTLKLLALLVLSLMILIGYALVPDRIASTLHLKQLSLAATGHGSTEQDEEDTADTTQTEPVDTASQRILIFGDSMSQPLALRLSDYANANGHKLTCVTWCSSSTRQWAEGDTLSKYMAEVAPTQVFICLGSNELYTRDMKSCEKRIRDILAIIGKVPAIWIGPPNWCEDQGINQLLHDVMGSRAYYPSMKLTFERQKDGRHPTTKSSAMWMDKIVEWINAGHAVHPFRLKKPAKKDAHYRQVIILPPGTKHKTGAPADSLRHSAVPDDGAEMPSVPEEQSNTHTPSVQPATPAVPDGHGETEQ